MQEKPSESPIEMVETAIQRFLRLESAGGLILMFTAALAILIANSPLITYYNLLLDVPVQISIGKLAIDKPLLLWINDGLMKSDVQVLILT